MFPWNVSIYMFRHGIPRRPRAYLPLRANVVWCGILSVVTWCVRVLWCVVRALCVRWSKVKQTEGVRCGKRARAIEGSDNIYVYTWHLDDITDKHKHTHNIQYCLLLGCCVVSDCWTTTRTTTTNVMNARALWVCVSVQRRCVMRSKRGEGAEGEGDWGQHGFS